MTAKKEIIIYEAKNGKAPFEEWLENLKDKIGRAKIRVQIDRLEQGNMGKCASVGQGVSELKINFGPGYRVYFGQDGEVLVVLLCGGDKATQRKNINKAQLYWLDYKLRKEKKRAIK